MKRELERRAEEIARLTGPKDIVWCDGSEAEYGKLVDKMLSEAGRGGRPFLKLNSRSHPGGFWYSSDPRETARDPGIVRICSAVREDAGPLNLWMNPQEAKERMKTLLAGSMAGRTMYALAFPLGPENSPYSYTGFFPTDSVYTVLNMRKLYRVGKTAVSGGAEKIIWGVHSEKNMEPAERFLPHFPEEGFAASISLNYGGNSILAKKVFALRLASYRGFKDGWLAEHMLILELISPAKKKYYLAGAFPSACGKTNLAMLCSSLPGYEVRTVSDDLCWMHAGEDGKLRAIPVEKGFFAVARSTNARTNQHLMEAIKKNTLFTNTAVLSGGVPWWEGKEENVPARIRDWQGRKWNPRMGPVSHPNARFTVPAEHCSFMSEKWNAPEGVPIDAVIFGWRDEKRSPLVFQSFDYRHGIFVGLTMRSETTAAESGKTGILRSDPFAMLPFCGTHMGDYVKLHLEMGKKLKHPPLIFGWNPFLKNEKGELLYPGYEENIRQLVWIADCIEGRAEKRETSVGFVPETAAFNWDGLNVSRETRDKVFAADREIWKNEAAAAEKLFGILDSRLPREMREELVSFKRRLGS